MKGTFKEFLLTHKAKILVSFVVAFVIVPALLASVGAIVEHIIYGRQNAPRFHIEHMVYASMVCAPIIFARWIWPKNHLLKLEILIYGLSLTGFVTTLTVAMIPGETLYYTSEHIKHLFSDNFSSIATQKDVYHWLRGTLEHAFEDQKWSTTDSTNIMFRLLPGRVSLFGPVRLKQSRSKEKPCAQLLHDLGMPGLNNGATKCYSPYDIDDANTTTYGEMDFSYFNPTYLNYAGVNVSARDITSTGIFSTYPLSGFWVVWLPNQTITTVLSMLQAMEDFDWIDGYTREISLDFNIMMMDLSRVLLANVIYIVETAPSGRFLGRDPRISFNYYSEKLSDKSRENNDCGGEVDLEEEFLESAYFGVWPFIVYTIFVTILEICRNWRRRIKRLYTYLELAWVITASMAIAYRWVAIYYSHCNHLEYTQTIWPTNETYMVHFYEMKAISDAWLLSRQAMSVSFFLILVNFLQFVTRLNTLDTLTKTIERASRELGSFGFSFLVVYFAFVALFYLMFSADSKDYQSLSRTIVTLWTAMLGDITITEGMHLNRSWAIPLLILFTFTFVFVLLTVIIAIISDAHDRVRTDRHNLKEIQRQKSESAVSKAKRFFTEKFKPNLGETCQVSENKCAGAVPDETATCGMTFANIAVGATDDHLENQQLAK